MGKEQPRSYYDKKYSRDGLRGWQSYRKPRQRLFKVAREAIGDAALVVDLGCGPGHFAQFLDDHGWQGSYVGFDFSDVALAQARELMLGQGAYDFEWIDLASATRLADVPGATYVLMEVLEHIEDDRGVLHLVPPGATCIISVPQFDDPAHVRHFEEWAQVVDRYDGQLDIIGMEEVWRWYIFKAKRIKE